GFDRYAKRSRYLGEAMLFQQVEMVEYDARGQRFFHPDVSELLKQALAQIERRHAGWIEALHAFENALDACGVGLQLRCQVGDRSLQVAVVVEIVDDGSADYLIVLLER